MRTPLDDRERRWSLIASAVAAVASVALWAPAFDVAAGVFFGLLGVVLAGLLALAARSRRRVPTGLAAVLLAFGPWAFAWLIGFPFLCLAAWLLFRKPPRAEEAGKDDEADGRRARARRPARGQRAAPGRAGRRHPEANKRYTPPQRLR